MTMEERAEMAAELKHTGKANCAQAVLLAFQDKLGMSEEALRELGAGFGAGMGCMEGTCGALVAAGIAAGILNKGERNTVALSRQILAGFNEKSGATICKVLKGAGTGKVLCECDDCVRNGVKSLMEVIQF